MADLDTLQSHLILTINGGSSSIKFAIFFADKPPKRIFSGQIDRIGKPGSRLTAKREAGGDKIDQALSTANVVDAVNQLIDFLKKEIGGRTVLAIGHRVVHGGVRLIDHQVITSAVMEELKRAMPMDISHLPAEISLIDEFAKSFTSIPQVACFDTAFHRDLPRMAKLLPIPRKYDEAGIHKFGFHGLSYAYLMQELAEAGKGKVILSHLGSGASMAAVKDGKPFDTSMSFTPTAGIVMGTRPGDFDPGLLVYLMRAGKMSADQLDEFINKKCGLLGISETSSDVRDLIEKSSTDKRAAEAIESFCYHAKKQIGAFAAAMGGLDTLVFAGGIGEHSADVRAGICAGLEFLGVAIDNQFNAEAKSIISSGESRVTVRIIKTDEEWMIAQAVQQIVKQ